MAFRVPSRTATIKFDDSTPYSGLEVTVRLDLPMRSLFAFQGAPDDTPAEREASLRMFAEMALRDWNMEDDSGRVSADGDGFLSLPFALANTIIAKWVEAATQPTAPLNGASSDTKRSLEESMPMVSL